MNLDTVLLSVHIAAGSLGLVLGPILFVARKAFGTHTRGGELYQWTFLVLFLSAPDPFDPSRITDPIATYGTEPAEPVLAPAYGD